MLSFEIAQVPSFMNNMAGGTLKRLSAAVGYNMACYSQEEVEKQLPKSEQKRLAASDAMKMCDLMRDMDKL